MVFVRLLVILMVLSTSAAAQNLISGSLKGLKKEKSYNIKFTYDSMIVGSDTPEEQYLERKKNEWEAKEPGKGSAFVSQWFVDRQRLFEPAFILNFEYYTNLKLKDENAKYTLIVKTQRTEGGWNVGVASHTGEIGGELWITESADPSRVIAKIAFSEFRGKFFTGGDFEMTARIKSAYAIAGRWLGDFIRRKAK